ncbi:hypothetical protein GCM10018953_54760 [Streptosporangium nondiastaticum]
MLTATPACRATSAIVTVRPLMRLLARRTRSRALSEGEAGQGDPSVLEHHIEIADPADVREPGADLGEVLTSSPP